MTASTYYTQKTDSQSYSDGYEIFLKRTNFREKILAYFKVSFPNELKALRKIRVLDLGCGDGVMTKLYIEALREILGPIDIELFLLEPAAKSLNLASERVKSLTKSISGINQTADDYFLGPNEETFDLIIASYVFYHIDPNLIPKIASKLNSNGAMAIMMGSRNHPLREHPDLRSVSKHGDSDILLTPLEEANKKYGLSIARSNISTDVDLNGLWDPENSFSEDGKKFFSFIYNFEIVTFEEKSTKALESVLSKVLSDEMGIIHPIHEFIWLERY